MKKPRVIYLDHASTTPIAPGVLKVMTQHLEENYGNPSSLHRPGRIAKKGLEDSRQKIAGILGVEGSEIVFTSGGTESDNLAILGLARANQSKGKHIIVSGIEHKAILDACKVLLKDGFEITYLDVDKSGLVSLSHLKGSLRPDSILVSIMYANNEIGVIQPLKKISKIIKESKALNAIFHSDACQAVNYLPLSVKALGVDAMTFSSSKIYGPKGAGCLYVNKKYLITPVLVGGGQEKGIRSGTESVPTIAAFAEALVLTEKLKIKESARLSLLRDYFLSEILKHIDGVTVNGSMKNRLPNNLNISIKGVEGEALVLLLDDKNVYCSTGSACSNFDLGPSHVLLKIGVPVELAHCSLRFSLGRETKKADIDYAVKALSQSVQKMKSMSILE